jgi:two-component system NtrC family sensor kinase
MSIATHAASADQQLHSVLDTLEGRFAELQRQVTTLQRLAAMGTASAALAHEFNNILTPVLSYCQFAQQRNDAELTKTALEKTIKNITRLTSLCSRIMNMASGGTADAKSVSIRELVMDAVECLGRDLKKDDIQFSLDVSPDLSFLIDQAALHQVIFNLLLNARQALSNRRGRLSICAERDSAGQLQIEVTDSGPGIPAEHLDRIFEPFFTTRRNQEGAGLGLHVCRQLMEEMNGEIRVVSTPGSGTTFILKLPRT